MFIQNLENFPIVRISYQAEDAVSVDETITIYESLLSRKETFVFISEGAFPEQKMIMKNASKLQHGLKQNVKF
ncbi:hypothetical protein ACG95P_09190 [Acinetobacter guillouiae]|uniref:hypothetical protein n=1 Tax=Acinetobacter guillouiae TaxID=106649 RepID=UPI003AF763DA